MTQPPQLLDREHFTCPICLDLLHDPVAIPCGHSYCMGCIRSYWGENYQGAAVNCPQCRQSFSPRPCLNRNTILAEMADKLRVTTLTSSPSSRQITLCNVECDFCTEVKDKAVKSCLVCLASYCRNHLQPHYRSPALKKHKLIDASAQLEEKICPQHNKLLEIYCQTDQQCICLLCVIDGHKGHDTVSTAAESAKQQKQLGTTRRKLKLKIHAKEKEFLEMQQAVDSLKSSVKAAVWNSEQIFSELVRVVESRCQEAGELIRDQERAGVMLLGKLQQEILQLKQQDSELELLLHTDDHVHVLQTYQMFSASPGHTDLASISITPLSDLGNVTNAIAALRAKLERVFKVEWPKIVRAASTVRIHQSPVPRIRPEFLYYSCQVTLDLHTAHRDLSVSQDCRSATVRAREHSWQDHPERFDYWCQVLSSEALSGCCYWEAEWTGLGVGVAVTYKDLSRKGDANDAHLGYNTKSWSLFCSRKGYSFRHNNVATKIPGPGSSRIGVYLDQSAGMLSFYSISDTMTLLHKVQTTFTQPLYTGFEFSCYGVSVTICQME